VAVLILLALVGVLVIIVVSNRADPDPSGRRPQSVYFFAVSFVTLTTSIIGSAVVVVSLIRFIGGHSSPIADSIARSLVIGGLITIVSFILLRTHLQRGLALVRADEGATTPSKRVGQSYVSAVAFVAILTLLIVSVFAVYLIFSIAGPGVFGSVGGRISTLRVFLETLYVADVALVVLWTHRNLIDPPLQIFGGMRAAAAPSLGPVDAPAPGGA
jgi:hypothetical protein